MKIKTFSLYEVLSKYKNEMDSAGAVERYIDNKPFMTDDDYAVKDIIRSTVKELCEDRWITISTSQAPILHSMYLVEHQIKLAPDKTTEFSVSALMNLTVEIVRDRNTRTAILDLLNLCRVYLRVSRMGIE